ncbi:MAG: DUF2512 family protein [Firmicutes bacterium]|nr:DUF2512 family protein [Bacillota bacterium]
MDNTYAVLIGKFILAVATALLAFSFMPGSNWYWSLVIGTATTIITFLVSDLILYRYIGNISASIVDGIIGTSILSLVSLQIPAVQVNTTAGLVFFFVLAVGGFVFRNYLERNGMLQERDRV